MKSVLFKPLIENNYLEDKGYIVLQFASKVNITAYYEATKYKKRSHIPPKVPKKQPLSMIAPYCKQAVRV